MIRMEPFDMHHLRHFISKDGIEPKTLNASMARCLCSDKYIMGALVDQDFSDVYGIVYLFELGPGSCEAGLIPSVDLPKKSLQVFRCLKDYLDKFVFDQLQLHRVQIAISTQWPLGDKWARALGFSFEGIARAYDEHKVDHAIYARVVK